VNAAATLPPKPAFTGFRFSPELIAVAVGWYLGYGPSYRDVERLLLERGVEVDHVARVAVHAAASRRVPVRRQSPGDTWHANETYVKVNDCGGTSSGGGPVRAAIDVVGCRQTRPCQFAEGRRCIAGSVDIAVCGRARGQIAWASSVNAAATRTIRLEADPEFVVSAS